MPGFTCCVPGCYNNSHRDKALHFYTFPKDAELRRLWLKNVSRAGVSGCFSTFQPTTGHRVCSEHFPAAVLLTLQEGGAAQEAAQALRGAAAAAAAAAGGIALGGGTSSSRRRRRRRQQQQQQQQQQPLGLGRPLRRGRRQADRPDGAAGAGRGRRRRRRRLGGGGGGGPVSLAFLAASEHGAPGLLPTADGPPDHSYSLSSGTTSEELLRKLNEQRDIIALLEVKMKEMKGSIRRLRLAEAQLREEIREKDRLLHAASLGGGGGGGTSRKRHGL
ncbi:hypothetical protein JRQ81_006273 [Phrynocephalus forsythii]|uniref:THAP domain-containing protein 11 n=1 Tax=Phrynocephalus forsythii TaxID=171643 RepID=A0A9Q1AUU3_9SAUR|nr:hypothetical protein JRQ81_006273 [Phrynocephalus forsythii]